VSAVFVTAMFMSIMDGTIVNVALPAIGRDFGVASTAVGRISIAYLVSVAVFMPAAGWLGDRFGGKRVLLGAVVVFTATSALCGIAVNVGQLVAFRIVQGIGGAMFAPVGMAMLFRAFPPCERLRASAILTVPTTLAPALGPVVGGLLVTWLSWRWIFYVNVPVGIAAFVFGLLCLDPAGAGTARAFDWAGFLLAGLGLGTLMFGLAKGPVVGWGNPSVLGGIGVGAVLLAVMVVVELRAAAPMVDLRLLRDGLFRSCNAVIVAASIAFLGTLYAVSLYLQDGRGLTAVQSGLSIFPEALGVMAGAQLAGRVLYPRLGPRRHIALGLVGTGASIALMALMDAHASLWWVRLLMFLMGFSMGQVFVPTRTAAFATISSAATGRASMMFNALRQLGGAVGIATLTTAVALAGPTHAVGGRLVANLDAYQVAFLVAAGVCLVGVACALTIRDADAAPTMPPRPRRRVTARKATGAAARPTSASDPTHALDSA
jgi:EmrB/QacA subfamily drug resistance transporter